MFYVSLANYQNMELTGRVEDMAAEAIHCE